MDFHEMSPEPHYLAADGNVVTYDNMASLSSTSSPRPEFEYGLLNSTSMQMASSYNLSASNMHLPLTPDPSPVDQLQIEFTDLAAPYPEDINYKPRKQDGKTQPSTSMHMRRRAQNRASQRAFRERKEKHTQELQRRLSEVEQQYDCLKQQFDLCQRQKGQLELQARRCSCGGHEVLMSPDESGRGMSMVSTPSSISSSSVDEPAPHRAASAREAAGPVGAATLLAEVGRPTSEPEAVNMCSSGGGGGGGRHTAGSAPVVDGLHELDDVYWTTGHHQHNHHC